MFVFLFHHTSIFKQIGYLFFPLGTHPFSIAGYSPARLCLPRTYALQGLLYPSSPPSSVKHPYPSRTLRIFKSQPSTSLEVHQAFPLLALCPLSFKGCSTPLPLPFLLSLNVYRANRVFHLSFPLGIHHWLFIGESVPFVDYDLCFERSSLLLFLLISSEAYSA